MRGLVMVLLAAVAAAQTASITTTLTSTITAPPVIGTTNLFIGALAKSDRTAGYAASIVSIVPYGQVFYWLQCTEPALCGPTEITTHGSISSDLQGQRATITYPSSEVSSYVRCYMTVSATSVATCVHVDHTYSKYAITLLTSSYNRTISIAYTQVPIIAYGTLGPDLVTRNFTVIPGGSATASVRSTSGVQVASSALGTTGAQGSSSAQGTAGAQGTTSNTRTTGTSTGGAVVATDAVYKILVAPVAAVAALAML